VEVRERRAQGPGECTLVVGRLGLVRLAGGDTDRVLGVAPRELAGRHLKELLASADRTHLVDLMGRRLAGGGDDLDRALAGVTVPGAVLVALDASRSADGEIASWVLRFAARSGASSDRSAGPPAAPAQLGEGRLPDLSPARLERALRHGELDLDLQPIIDLRTGLPDEFEALVRWQLPGGARLPAAAFIHAVEAAGLMGRLTRIVLERSLEQLARWTGHTSDRRLAVNVTADELARPEFGRMVTTLVGGAGIDPGRLVLELGQDSAVSDPDAVSRACAHLRDIVGVRLAIDGFSTRRSSLAALDLPIDVIKLDPATSASAAGSDREATVLATLAELCRTLDIAVVGKGIEDRDQLDALRRAGCSHGQGFLLGRPSPSSVSLRPLQERRVDLREGGRERPILLAR
jgi:EAL domain-containing protein (putative c-di-GMP-specific phosphodiesterase class I)